MNRPKRCDASFKWKHPVCHIDGEVWALRHILAFSSTIFLVHGPLIVFPVNIARLYSFLYDWI